MAAPKEDEVRYMISGDVGLLAGRGGHLLECGR